MTRALAFFCAAFLALPLLGTAQEPQSLFGPPALVLQPGVVKPLSRGAGSEFNARFLTVIPTAIPRTALLAIVQWTPFRSLDDPDGGASHALNSPSFVYGPSVRVFSNDHVTLFADAVFAYSPSASNPPQSDYTHKFMISGDVFVHVGRMVGGEGPWRNLSLYTFVARAFTGVDDPSPPAPALTGRDRMVVLAGLSLPVAPW
jgi:hypothetical protein